MYNPRGRIEPVTYRFPFPDSSFDVIALFSVFTHTTPPTVHNYVQEIARMLKPGGRLLASMFIVDESTRSRIANGETHRPFQLANDADGTYWTDNPGLPESAIGFDDTAVNAMLSTAGLDPPGPFVRGGWRLRREGQDLVIARRPG